MRANRLKEIWAAGRPVINGWMNAPGGFHAEVMAGNRPFTMPQESERLA